MKGELFTPEPVEPQFILTMTQSEASVLRKILLKCSGSSNVLNDLKNSLVEVTAYGTGVKITAGSRGLIVNDITYPKDDEW